MHDFILAMKHHQEKEDIAPFISKTLVTYFRRHTCEEKAENISQPTQSKCDEPILLIILLIMCGM